MTETKTAMYDLAMKKAEQYAEKMSGLSITAVNEKKRLQYQDK